MELSRSGYHTVRIHQGLGNQIIEPADEAGQVAGTIGCRKRLGGMLAEVCCYRDGRY